MSYITLTPELFFDEDGDASMEYLSQYCQLPTTKKFIYDGDIHGSVFTKLIFNNIVKANYVTANKIPTQFPDLEKVDLIFYYVTEMYDIGNLNYAGRFYAKLEFNYDVDINFRVFNIKKYVSVIDENTLIINGKKLKVDEYWEFSHINKDNYIKYGL